MWRDNVLCAVTGPDCVVKVTEAGADATYYPQFSQFRLNKGDVLNISRYSSAKPPQFDGARGYIAFSGGIQVPLYLGSRSTFVNGEFGGFRGRSLKKGDMVPLADEAEKTVLCTTSPTSTSAATRTSAGLETEHQPLALAKYLPEENWPKYSSSWKIGVLPGPRASPDFMLKEDIEMLHATEWKVHHNSNRLGIRLNGPKPTWARPDGGEGGSHPSNIHDEEYAVGTINFTGDMPIIIAHDGPSLGGFVCPITICQSELWKIGQVKAGDSVQFHLWDLEKAMRERISQDFLVKHLRPFTGFDASIVPRPKLSELLFPAFDEETFALENTAVLYKSKTVENDAGNAGGAADGHQHPGIAVRMQGDRHVLVEYGPMLLDLRIRVRVHFLEQNLLAAKVDGLEETAPGVRSLQIRYSPLKIPLAKLLQVILFCDQQIGDDLRDKAVKTRVFYLPMAYDSSGCAKAMDKYSRSIRDDAPYLPSNLDYVAKNNGLYKTNADGSKVPDQQEVHKRIFRASYMCLGLGDVYLGACCAVPVNPLDRMITTKMNPARTWTEEGTVGLGGAYMCIYPMYSPGGYQLVGRTLPIWNSYALGATEMFTPEKPWLLEMFHQIRFYEVSEPELDQLREDFRAGSFVPKVETEDFNLAQHQEFLREHKEEIAAYQAQQRIAMAEQNEEERLSQIRLSAKGTTSAGADVVDHKEDHVGGATSDMDAHLGLAGEKNVQLVDAYVSGSVWAIPVQVGDEVKAGDTLVVLEAMKMEIPVTATVAGKVAKIFVTTGQMKEQGDPLVAIVVPTSSSSLATTATTSSSGTFKVVESSGSFKTVDSSSAFRVVEDGQHADEVLVAKALASMEIADLHEAYRKKLLTPVDVVAHLFDSTMTAYEEEVENSGNIWISKGTRDQVLQTVRSDVLPKFEEFPPLYGIPFVVKDNYDVEDWDTTCACVEYRRRATETAECIQQLLDAGAILLGKTNLDQFATGLVGTRSPFGACANPFDSRFISGGSSSGSAAAVALRFATFSLGTDTAGSGRVPASYCNIVGLKPSRNLISNHGMVPACKTLDCVSVFALCCQDALTVLETLKAKKSAGKTPSETDPGATPSTTVSPFINGATNAARSDGVFPFVPPVRVNVPEGEVKSPKAIGAASSPKKDIGRPAGPLLLDLADEHKKPFCFAVPDVVKFFCEKGDARTQMQGLFDLAGTLLQSELMQGKRKQVSLQPFVETAELLYQGPWVAERAVAVEEAGCLNAMLPVTAKVLSTAEKHSAVDCFKAFYRLEELKAKCMAQLEDVDFLLLPTVPTCWTIAEVDANPVETNTQNGYYTNFMNLLDLAGVALPMGFLQLEDGAKIPFGVTLCGKSGTDQMLLSYANRLMTINKASAGRTGR
ncbi:unnamed protein product [Amoebophrya sp. A120]|nr:unnamed protein product [Amoebophrya sp. A120]|eukprot:GSA120T00002511001.1